MSNKNRDGYIGMSAVERRLIELTRESEDAKKIAEDFIFGPPRFPTDPQAPSGVQETFP